MNMKKIILCALLALGVSFASHSQQKLYVIKDGAITHTIPLSEIGYITTGIGYEYVDLGLSVKWATCNVGASAPEEAGYYFAFGETQPKEIYSPSTSITHKLALTTAEVQSNTQRDAATANWGGTWRTPTSKEVDDLVSTTNTTWTWTEVYGVKGYSITSKVAGYDGYSIFLNAEGLISYTSVLGAGTVGEYWTSTPYGGEIDDEDKWAHFLLFYNNTHISGGGSNHYRMFFYRSDGRPIRPVCPK